MSTYSAHSYYPAVSHRNSRTSWISRFFKWSEGQEKNRFGWVAAILTLHGCILLPITMMAIFAGGLHFAYLLIAGAAMTACLVSNLAAMPTRITIPIFFFSILIDIAIIAVAVYSLIV